MKVSVVIPTYNRPDSLHKAIRSVLQQSFQDFEIIVVDDASTMENQPVIQELSDPRIRYIRHSTNRREAGSRNTGIRNARGEYIAFLDDDDEWLPEKLQKQVAILDTNPPEVGVVYTGRFAIDRKSRKLIDRRIPVIRGDVLQDLFKHNFTTGGSSILARKACFDEVGLFDESLPNAVDHDMWIRIAKKYRFECVPEALVRYYVHPNRLNSNLEIIIQGWEVKLERYRRYFDQNPIHCSRHYRKLGTLNCLNGNSTKSRKAYRMAIRLHPLSLRTYFMFALSFFGSRAMWALLTAKEKLIASFRPAIPE
jgi:glycosyltransferase involved in cell wall biosynthesis